MNIAYAWLRDENCPVSQAASKLGYQSEAVFSRAFKAQFGEAPGGVRRSSN